METQSLGLKERVTYHIQPSIPIAIAVYSKPHTSVTVTLLYSVCCP